MADAGPGAGPEPSKGTEQGNGSDAAPPPQERPSGVRLVDPAKMDDKATEPTPNGTEDTKKAGTAERPASDTQSTYELGEVVRLAFLAWLGFLILTVLVLWLWSWELAKALVGGVLVGMAAAGVTRWNMKRKAYRSRLVSMPWVRCGCVPAGPRFDWLDSAPRDRLWRAWKVDDCGVSTPPRRRGRRRAGGGQANTESVLQPLVCSLPLSLKIAAYDSSWEAGHAAAFASSAHLAQLWGARESGSTCAVVLGRPALSSGCV